MTACSSDDEEVIDSSFITDFSWVLSSYTVLDPVDLNKDGVPSTNMIDEFDCLKMESISFSPSQNALNYNDSPLIGISNSNAPENSINRFECNDFNISNPGTYRMINHSMIELKIDLIFGDASSREIIMQLECINDKLVQSIDTIFYEYDEENKVFVRGNTLIEKVYVRYSPF